MSEVGFLESEMTEVFSRFRRLGKAYAEAAPRVAGIGGSYLASAAEAAAPKGRKTHRRYSTAKVNKSMRAPKGMGAVVATYSPGNLARSMQVLKLRRTKSAVIVGANLTKGSAKGNYSGMRTDGYYLHMVEGGTRNWPGGRPFFMATWARVRPRVEKIMIDQFTLIAQRFNAENQ